MCGSILLTQHLSHETTSQSFAAGLAHQSPFPRRPLRYQILTDFFNEPISHEPANITLDSTADGNILVSVESKFFNYAKPPAPENSRTSGMWKYERELHCFVAGNHLTFQFVFNSFFFLNYAVRISFKTSLSLHAPN